MERGRLLGRGIAFPPRIDETTGGFVLSEGEENIRESIQIILMTNPGERQMLPEFGGGISFFLFEPNTLDTRRRLQERITQALTRWESRIQLDSVQVVEDPRDPETALVTIAYTVVMTQAEERIALAIRLAGQTGG